MSDRRLLQIQALSGLVFLLFVLVHLANTMVAIGGPDAYNAFQRGARRVYQFPPVEVLVLALPLLVHVAAAITRLRRSGFRRPGQSWRARLHRYTGYYLLLVIFGHVAAVRGSSLFFGVHPEFGGVSFTLWWLPWNFYPYYVLFALCAVYHGLNGLSVALSTLGRPLPDRLRRGPAFWAPVGVAGVLLLFGVLALGGKLFEIPDPTDNDAARMLQREFGVDLQR